MADEAITSPDAAQGSHPGAAPAVTVGDGGQPGNGLPPFAAATINKGPQFGDEGTGVKPPAPFDLNKPSPEERGEPRQFRSRDRDLTNEAVGSDFMVKGHAECGWHYDLDGWPFGVTRFYPTCGVAVDWVREHRDVERFEEKRAKVERMGIAYVAILPNEAFTIDELREKIVVAKDRAGKALKIATARANLVKARAARTAKRED